MLNGLMPHATFDLGDDNDTVIDAGSGTQTFNGGTGTNTVEYQRPLGTAANFVMPAPGVTTTGSGAPGENDQLNSMQNAIGGDEDDTFIAPASSATQYSFDGGNGTNTLSYVNRSTSVSATLPDDATGTQRTRSDNTDGYTLTNVLNVIGGSAADILTGGTGPNDITGGGGADQLDGKGGTNTLDYSDHTSTVSLTLPEPSAQLTTLPGADGDQVANFTKVTGGTGNDNLTGNSQVNVIRGGNGDDTLNGGDDAPGVARKGDTLDGQGDNDTIDYSARTATVNVSLDGVANDGENGEGDNVVPSAGKDIIKGGHAGDVFRGGTVAATFQGNDGNDQFWDGTGSEEFAGGNQTDVAHYDNDTSTVIVSLDDVANDGPVGQTDNIHSDVEEVDGGSGADLLVANPQKAATLRGNGGNDIIKGSLMSDTLDGGADTNSLTYDDTTDAPANQRTVGVTVTLPERGAANATKETVRPGEVDTISDFTNIVGSSQGDVIHGNTEANNIQGGPGIDTLYGGDGNDVMSGGPGNDTLYGEKGDEMFNADADPGADTYSGGLGNNTISYANSTAKVTVSLDGVANDGQSGEGDNVGTDIQNVFGSRYDDTIDGASTGGNVLMGGAGNDTITGHGTSATTPSNVLFGDSLFDSRVSGNDVIAGGPGVDTFYAGPGNDLIKSVDLHAENIFCGAANDYDVLIPDKFTDGHDDVPQADCNAERHGQGATWWVPGWSDCANGPTTADPNALVSCVHQVAGTQSYGGDAASSMPNRIDTVYRNGNNIVYRAKSCFALACGWSSTTLPALAPSVLPVAAPSISARNANTLDVIAYGQHQPAALPTPHVYWMCVSTTLPSTCGASGLGWTDITGTLGTLGATGSDGPEVARLTDNSFVVFATNWVNGCGIKYKVWNNGTWRDWSCVMNTSVIPSDRTGDSIVFGSNFGAVSKADNDVMVVGVDKYGQLVQSHMGFDGTGYGILAATAGTWTALGSVCNNPTHPYNVFNGVPLQGGCPFAGKPAISHTPGTSNYDIVLDDSDRFALWWKPIRNGVPQAGRMLLGNTQMFGTPAVTSYGSDPNNTQLYVSTASVDNHLWEGTYNQVDPPLNSVPPTISGTLQYGQTLTVSSGVWNDPRGTQNPTYAWFRLPSGGALQPIMDPSGAQHGGPTYTITGADGNAIIVVLVGVSNGVTSNGLLVTTSSAVVPTPPTNSAPPTISGTVAYGQTLSVANSGTWGGIPAPTLDYAWQSCMTDGSFCSTLSTASTYKVGAAALGGAIRLSVTGRNAFGSLPVSSAMSGAVPTQVPTLTTPPTIAITAGTLNTHSLLVSDYGFWSLSGIPAQAAYQWLDCPATGGTCTNVQSNGQTNQYVPTAADVGKRLQVKVTVTFLEGPSRIAVPTNPVYSATTAAVAA